MAATARETGGGRQIDFDLVGSGNVGKGLTTDYEGDLVVDIGE